MIDFYKWNELRAGHTAKPKIRVDLFYISPGDGNGDLLYNTCREIIDRDENDPWTHLALEEVFMTLVMGVRWPVRMNRHITLGEARRLEMTQDPWLLAYCCAVHLNRIDLIEDYKPKFGIFKFPDKRAWRRSLLGKPNLYWFWRRVIPFRFAQDFVYVFYGYMELTYLNK